LKRLAGTMTYNKFTSHRKSLNYFRLFKARGWWGRKIRNSAPKTKKYLITLTNSIIYNNNEKHVPRPHKTQGCKRSVKEVNRPKEESWTRRGGGWV